MPIDANPLAASASPKATTRSRWPPRPCCWMTTGQPAGGGVPLGTTTVNGICAVSITTGWPAPSRVKRSSVVSHGPAGEQEAKGGGKGGAAQGEARYGGADEKR